MVKRYTVSDGKLLLTLQEGDGDWYVVTSPTDPAMITQARSVPEAFAMAKDAFAELVKSRADKNRWAVPLPKKRQRKVATGI